MSVRALHAELNAVRALMSDGLVATAGGDLGQFWVRSACARLTEADAALIEAAGVLAAPVRAGLTTLVLVPTMALAAGAAEAAGLGTAGMLTAAGLVLLVLLAAGPWASRRLRIAVGHRRLARAANQTPDRTTTASPRQEHHEPAGQAHHEPAGQEPGGRDRGSTGAHDPDTAGPSTPEAISEFDRVRIAGSGEKPATVSGRVPISTPRLALAGVPDLLLRARVRLVSATLRQAGPGRWSAAELRLAARTDPVVRRLAHADLLLCQAVDCLERYLDDAAEGWS